MNPEKIRKRLAAGFRPFILRTSDGEQYDIPHPEFIAIGKYDVAVVNKDGDIDIIDPLHIVSFRLIGRNNVSGSGK